MADKKLIDLLTNMTNKIKTLEGTINTLIPAVGDIEINVSGKNPSEKYPGTTWADWGGVAEYRSV